MKVIDPGHRYLLGVLDYPKSSLPEHGEHLQFVKRNFPPEKYPGNLDAYPGTTIQECLRACIDRGIYVNNQKPHPRTMTAVYFMRRAIWELELRAAELHGRELLPPTSTQFNVENLPTCPKCMHIQCDGNCHNEFQEIMARLRWEIEMQGRIWQLGFAFKVMVCEELFPNEDINQYYRYWGDCVVVGL